MASGTGAEETIVRANLLLRGRGFSREEARVEPLQDVAVLRGTLVTQRIETAEKLLQIIRDLPTRTELVALLDDEVDRSTGAA